MSPKKINVTDSGSDSDSATSSSSDESSSSSSSDASSSSSSSSSLSGSDDTSPTKSEHLSSSSGDDEQPTRSRKSSKDLAKLAEELPDLYGIRRSSRARKEPTRLEIGKGQAGKRGKRSRRKSSADWNSSDDSESSGSSSEGSVEKFKPTRGRRPQKSRGRTRGRGGKRKTYSDSDEESTPERRTTSSRSAAHSKKIRGKRPKSQRKTTNKKVSYRENSGESQTDDDDVLEWTQPEKEEPEGPPVETIEKVLKRRIGRKMASGSKTAIYIVQEEGDPNEGFDPDKEEGDVQYLIKWKNWSYIHNTWDSEKNLMEQRVNGLKKLDNFKKFRNELEAWKRLATPEDIEYLEYQNEMVVELADTHLKVERIITHQASRSDGVLNVFPDYLIKWQGLPYSDCTWEAGELISKKFHSSLEEYNTRNKAQTIPSKYCKALKTRPKFQTYKEQPDYLGSAELQLRDYQLDGLNWLVRSWCKENSVILADEMGLGKTIQIISFVSSLMYSHQLYGPFLIVVPLSTIVAWQREFQLWVPKINVVLYIGDIQSRNRIREFEWAHPGNKRLKFNVIVTTYEILLKDKSFLGSVHWAALAVDEAHRLKNDDSLLYKSLIDFKTNHRVLVTGTPLQNSLKELWSLLHFIMPDRFNSWSEFEEKHQNSDNTGFSSLHKQLEPFLLRRMKKDVEKSLPSKTEQILRVEMTKQQKQYYRWILTKNYKALSKGVKGSISGFLNIVMELKKCCNHCFLTRAPEDEDNSKKDPLETVVKSSGKMILLDKLLMRLRDTGHRVLIFSQMVRLLDILAEYMKLRHFQFQRLDGSIQGEQRKQAMDHFNAEGSEDFCFLLSTRAGGLGVNLASADTVIIFDSDWNPQNDLQAMARAHRIGQKKQVSVYRLVTKGSVEEDIIERAKQKMVLDHLVIQRMDTTGRTVLNKGMNSSGSNPFNKAELACILKFGAEDLFKENEDEEGELQVDIDEILKRAETTHTEAHNSATDDLLSNFKVVSFDNLEDQELEGRDAGKDWDNIIPSKDRQIIEDEEEARRLKELNLPPRQRKQVTQFNAYDSDDDKENKKKKKSSKYDDEESSYDEDSDEDKSGAKKKVRGRGKGKIDGFNTSEIRRFVKSFKKFPKPLDRLEDISGDAELQEKSHSDLHRLGQIVMEQCQITMTEHEKQLENGTPEDNDGAHKKSSRRGPTALIGSVAINAKQVIQSAYELDPLAVAIPADKEKRKKYQLTCRVKFVNWDCVWEPEDDSNLLKGIYEYGMGSWEAIKMDPELNLHDKILPDGKLKPQVNHISTRAEYLIKVLRKDLNMEDSKTPPIIKANKVPRAKKTKANPRVKSAEIITDDISDESDENRPPNKNDKLDESFSPSKDNSAKRPKKKRQKEKKTSVERDVSKDKKKREKNDKKEKKEKHQKSRTVVYTESFEPVALDENGKPVTELASETFVQCKDKMRPVKKSLKQLDKSDPELNESEQEEHVRQCLMAIGDHIGVILSELQKTKSKSQLSQWRDHLWIFVSKFTEFDANKLHKIYRRAVNKRDGVSKMHSETKSHKSHGSHSGKKKRLSNDGPNDASQHKQKHRENMTHRQSAHQRQNKSQSLENFTDGSSQESWQNANGPRHHGHNNGPIGANEMWTHTSPLDRRMAGRDSNSYTKWSSGGSQHDQNFQHAGPSGGKQHGYHGNNQNRYGDGGHYGNKQFQRDGYNKNRGGAGGTHEGGYSKHRREQGQHGAGGGGWRDRDPGGYHSNNKPNRENWQETGGFGGPNSNVYDRKRMRDPRDSSRENRESRPPKDQRMGESRTWSSHREEWGAYHPPRHHGSNENNGGGQNSYNKDNRSSEPGHASDPRMSRVKAQSTQSQYSSSPHH